MTAPDLPGWRVAGASVIGTAHARAGLPCQDAHRYDPLPGGRLVIAVADGAGSAPRADEGARLAVEAAAASLARSLAGDLPPDDAGWRESILAACEAALAAIVARAEEMEAEASPRDFATTLTVVAATPERLVVGQIGDGIAVAEGDDGLFLAIAPQRGEYANEVALLTTPGALEGVAVAPFDTAVRAIAVTTDGLLRLAVRLPDHTPHAPFFGPLFTFLAEAGDPAAAGEELAQFLASARVAERTDDDKTLVLAVRAAPPGDDAPAAPPAGDGHAG